MFILLLYQKLSRVVESIRNGNVIENYKRILFDCACKLEIITSNNHESNECVCVLALVATQKNFLYYKMCRMNKNDLSENIGTVYRSSDNIKFISSWIAFVFVWLRFERNFSRHRAKRKVFFSLIDNQRI